MTEEKAIEILQGAIKKPNTKDGYLGQAIDMVIKALEQKSRKGYWIKTGDYYTGAYGSIEYVKCSCCHEDSLEEGDFCPNCGVKMIESEE